MILGVVGSKKLCDSVHLRQVGHVLRTVLQSGKVKRVVSGGEKGIDRFGVRVASKKSIPTTECHPDWKFHGSSAGDVRYGSIAWKATHILIFAHAKRKDTQTMVEICQRMKKPYRYYVWDDASRSFVREWL
jgi:hypothetical protein